MPLSGSTGRGLVVAVMLCSALPGRLLNQIPDYIEVCKREQATIDACVKSSIEKLRPQLAEGIPELNVPGIEPFYIPELVVDRGDLVQFKAVGQDVKVSGAGNFSIKSISVDLDTLTLRGRVRFPHLHFEGKYTLDGRLLVVPLRGQGNLVADASRCEAEMTVQGRVVEREGVEYIKFTAMQMDINVKDYRVRLDGLFNGNEALGESANQAINQNRAEFLRASKPYVERTCSRLLLNMANKIASTFPLDQLLPLP